MLQVFEIPMLDLSLIPWKKATKTKAIFARSIHTLINDIPFFGHLTLNTFEGPQALKTGSMVCTGLARSDPWQQSPQKLLQKYNVVDITPDGWLYCEPKPDNEVNCCQITGAELPPLTADYEPDVRHFQIYAQWGTEVWPDGVKKYLQSGVEGDYVCQSITDPTDVWIVKKSFFNATYEIK